MKTYAKDTTKDLDSILYKPQIFITSDLHLGHKNIIKYCDRPFRDTHDMNKNLVDNWNNAVRRIDQ